MDKTLGQTYVDIYNAQESIKYKMPNVNMVTQVRCNPLYTYDLAKQTMEYTRQFCGVSDENFNKNLRSIGVCGGYFWADCPDSRRLLNLIKSILCFIVIDDHFENPYGHVYEDKNNSRMLFDQINKALDRLIRNEPYVPISDWPPYVLSAYAIWEDMCQDLNAVSKQRMVDAFKIYFEGCLQEFDVCNSNTNVFEADEKELDEIQIKTSAVHMMLVKFEYSQNIAITEEEWNDPDLQAIIWEVAYNTRLSNDLFSVEKEVNHYKGDWNKVALKNCVVRAVVKYKLSILDAQKKVIKMFEDSEHKYIRLKAEYLAKADRSNAIKTFLESGCDRSLSGTLVISAVSGRYCGRKGSPTDPYGFYF